MKSLLKKLLIHTPIYNRILKRQYGLVTKEVAAADVEKGDKVLIAPHNIKPNVGIVADRVNIDGLVSTKASWLRYERFLKNNQISYGFYDIKRSDWLEQAKQFDIIVWHTDSSPSVQNIAESKLYILEKQLGKLCFPSFDEVWQYENKSRANYLYDAFELPGIPTFTSNSYKEAMAYIESCKYPIISKLDTASGSTGVKKILNKRQARKIVTNIFLDGNRTCWSYLKQKDYVYFQEFIDDATFDLRIFIVDNKAFGYYRYPNKGDFRASGAGNYEKKELPMDALKLAIECTSTLNSRLMSVDLLYSEKQQKYYIIETSIFNQIDTPEQLVVNGISGYYDISDLNNIQFKEGRFWLQELAIKVVVEQWIAQQQ